MKKLALHPAAFISGDATLTLKYPSAQSAGLEVSCKSAGSLKWIVLPVPVIKGDAIQEIVLNYRVTNSRSYISQIRLIEQNNPDSATVRHDDTTDLKSVAFQTYVSSVSGLKVSYSILLMLRFHFANTNDKIKIGGIEIGYHTQSNSRLTGIFNVKDFGASGDGVADDSVAFERALNAIDDHAGSFPEYFGGYASKRGAILFVPPGHYRLTKTLVLERSIMLQGGGKAISCNLHFDLPKDDSPFSGIIVKGQASTIRDLAVITSHNYGRGLGSSVSDDDTFDGEKQDQLSCGIIVRNALVTIENCYVSGFDHDGIHINSADGGIYNAWKVLNCWLGGNGRHGLFLAGNDANAGMASGTTAMANLRYGYYDNTLGNIFVGCHAEGNGTKHGDGIISLGGAFYIGSTSNSVLVGAFPDAGEKVAIKFPNLLLGGSVENRQIERIPSFDSNPPMILNGGFAEMNHFKETGTVSRYIRHLPEDGNNSEIYNYYNVILTDASTGPLTLTLPFSEAAEWYNRAKHGFQVTIKKSDATPNPVHIKINESSADRMENGTEYSLLQPYSWVTLIFEAINVRDQSQARKWYIIGKG